MNIENICVGQEFKNFKELCLHLGVKPAVGGRNTKLQKEEFERYFRYSKNGHKIKIEEIFKFEQPKIDKRTTGGNATYMKYIKDLVLYALRELNGEIGYVPVSRLLYLCEMVNQRYLEHQYNKKELAKELNMDISYVEEFYSRNHSALRVLIERALDSMEKGSLIELDCMTFAKVRVIKTDKNGNDYVDFEHRMVMDDELQSVIEITEYVQKKLGIKNPQEIYLKKKFSKFNAELNKALLSELGFYYTYKCYRIAPYKNRIIKTIEENEKDIIASQLSENVINKIEKESAKLHNKEKVKTFGKINSYMRSYPIQSNIDYCDNIKKIAEYVVRHNYFTLDKQHVNTDVYKEVKLMDFNEMMKHKNKKKDKTI